MKNAPKHPRRGPGVNVSVDSLPALDEEQKRELEAQLRADYPGGVQVLQWSACASNGLRLTVVFYVGVEPAPMFGDYVRGVAGRIVGDTDA